jgi:hypothetical protein
MAREKVHEPDENHVTAGGVVMEGSQLAKTEPIRTARLDLKPGDLVVEVSK